MKSGQYAFRDRRQRKRDFRKLWITRINAAARQHDISYSRLMNGLKKADININRKMLSEIAISDDKAFGELVSKAKDALKNNYLKANKVTIKPYWLFIYFIHQIFFNRIMISKRTS